MLTWENFLWSMKKRKHRNERGQCQWRVKMNVIYLRRKRKFISINFIYFAMSTTKLNTFMLSMSHLWNKRATDFILRVPASHSQKQIVPSAPVEDRYLFEPLHNGENWKTIKEKNLYKKSDIVQMINPFHHTNSINNRIRKCPELIVMTTKLIKVHVFIKKAEIFLSF